MSHTAGQPARRPPRTDVALRIEEIARRDPQEVLTEILSDFDERVERLRVEQRLPRRVEAVYLRGAAAVDRARLATFQRRVRKLGGALFERTGGQYHYLDIARFLWTKSYHVVDLQLDRLPPQDVLDLATGGGHFPFMATQYGHKVMGIDIDVPLYKMILNLYGMRRIARPIMRLQRMPLRGPYHLITALQPMFNRNYGGGDRKYWTVDEWIWFVEYLSTLLRYPGRIYFKLNRYYVDNRDMSDDLMDVFEANGANVDFETRSVLFAVDQPLKLST